jgi:hypothetical protein
MDHAEDAWTDLLPINSVVHAGRRSSGTGRKTAAWVQVVWKLDGPVVVQKGPADAISDGQQTIACAREGSPRRAGGQVRSFAWHSVAAVRHWHQDLSAVLP